jgi:membrane associated rhomboid family serine protease
MASWPARPAGPSSVFPIKDNIPTDRTPIVTIALIVINAIVYLFVEQGPLLGSASAQFNEFVVKYGAIPLELTHPDVHCTVQVCTTAPVHQPSTWITPFTSMFMHGSLLHLAGNMLFLWVFGNNVEDAMGRVRFVVFYLLGGVAALALQTAISPDAAVPTIGASGAIAAVLGGYIVLYPQARVVTVVFVVFFFTVLLLPAIVVLGIWFAEQAVFAALDQANPAGSAGGVAYFAHIGGFVFGLLTIKLFARRRKDVPAVASWRYGR